LTASFLDPTLEINNKDFAAIVDCQNGRTNLHKQEILILRQQSPNKMVQLFLVGAKRFTVAGEIIKQKQARGSSGGFPQHARYQFQEKSWPVNPTLWSAPLAAGASPP
jgi:hypothetical protein